MTGEQVRRDGQARLAFYGAILDVDELGGSLADRSVARWVASALEGIARGLSDAGDVAGASALRFAGSDMVRDLASGRWRNDVVEASALVGATDPDTEVIERAVSADGEVIA